MKIAVTPCVAVIEHFVLHLRTPPRLYLSLILIIIGVGLCTIRDFSIVCFYFTVYFVIYTFNSLEYGWLFLWFWWCISHSNISNHFQNKAIRAQMQLFSASSF